MIVLISIIFRVLSSKSKVPKKIEEQNDLIKATIEDKLKGIDYLREDLSNVRKIDGDESINFLNQILERISNHQNTTNKESDNWKAISGVVKYKFPNLVSPDDIIDTVQKALKEYDATSPKVPTQKEATPQEEYQFKPDGEPESGIKSGSSNSSFTNEDSMPAGPRFYFNNPVKSGFFIDEQKTPSRSSETLFEFSLNNDNPKEASYLLNPSPDAIPSALNFYTMKIEPVCDIENVQETYHKSIKHIKAGKARLEDGKWIIIHRAKARFV